MVYDSARRVTVLFGGGDPYDGGHYLGDTWEWDGDSWTERSPSVSPVGRFGHAMTYDSKRARVVLHGGWVQDNPFPVNDTWEYPVSSPVRVLSALPSSAACLGDTVTFTVTASGSPPISYQWWKNGKPIAGATSPKLVLDNVDFGSDGQYSAVVTNPCSSATSESAELSVCAGPGGCPQPDDVNGDGVVNGADIRRFVEILLGG